MENGMREQYNENGIRKTIANNEYYGMRITEDNKQRKKKMKCGKMNERMSKKRGKKRREERKRGRDEN